MSTNAETAIIGLESEVVDERGLNKKRQKPFEDKDQSKEKSAELDKKLTLHKEVLNFTNNIASALKKGCS